MIFCTVIFKGVTSYCNCKTGFGCDCFYFIYHFLVHIYLNIIFFLFTKIIYLFLTGVTLNWGVLIAWGAIHDCLHWTVVPLYIACVFYTMIYDSIYSHQVSINQVSFRPRKMCVYSCRPK